MTGISTAPVSASILLAVVWDGDAAFQGKVLPPRWRRSRGGPAGLSRSHDCGRLAAPVGIHSSSAGGECGSVESG